MKILRQNIFLIFCFNLMTISAFGCDNVDDVDDAETPPSSIIDHSSDEHDYEYSQPTEEQIPQTPESDENTELHEEQENTDACSDKCLTNEICDQNTGKCIPNTEVPDDEDACHNTCQIDEICDKNSGTCTRIDEDQKDEQIPGSEPVDACSNSCQNGEICDPADGSCRQVCKKGLTLCDGNCINLSLFHLESCDVCESNYCDADNNLKNGCEVNLRDDDVRHCGACGQTCGMDEICSSGACTSICDEGKTYCSGACKDFSQLHLNDCDTCADNYEDCDGNIRNGCESHVLNDFYNCGTCGHACRIGDSCTNGMCENTYSVHRRMVVDEENTTDPTLQVLDAPNGNVLGSLMIYEYFQALGEQELIDGNTAEKWYLLDFNGMPGWVDGFYTMDACDSCLGRKAVDLAESYLWTPENQMCTHDYYGKIPNLTNGADTHGEYYNNNCANFVTAILMNVGLISVHYDHVKEIRQYCMKQKEGYRMIDFADAKPGDIWMEKDSTHSHTELVVGSWNNGTHIITVGSMSFTSCGSDGVKTMNLAGKYQRVAYTDRMNEGSFVYICSRQ